MQCTFCSVQVLAQAMVAGLDVPWSQEIDMGNPDLAKLDRVQQREGEFPLNPNP